MPGNEQPQSSIVLYQTEDGQTRVQCRFENETIWLTQALIAELFQTSIPNINLHLKAIFAEGELMEAATVKSYLIVRSEGARNVSREVLHYSLPAILAVGYRVRSQRGTQFRQWATARLSEYLVKGFTMDDERLKNPPGKGHTDYFDELLERIRDIRSSERRFYQKVNWPRRQLFGNSEWFDLRARRPNEPLVSCPYKFANPVVRKSRITCLTLLNT